MQLLYEWEPNVHSAGWNLAVDFSVFEWLRTVFSYNHADAPQYRHSPTSTCKTRCFRCPEGRALQKYILATPHHLEKQLLHTSPRVKCFEGNPPFCIQCLVRVALSYYRARPKVKGNKFETQTNSQSNVDHDISSVFWRIIRLCRIQC